MNTELMFLHKRLETLRDTAWGLEEYFRVEGSIDRSMIYGEIGVEIERDRIEAYAKLSTKEKNILDLEQKRQNNIRNLEILNDSTVTNYMIPDADLPSDHIVR